MSDAAENSTAESEATPLVIKPLVLRHAEDAAFYWAQRSANAHTPLLRFDRLRHFDRLLTAHLDGLRVAGAVGWESALKNLQRWKGAGEAFAAYVLAIEAGDKLRLQALWEVLQKNPDAMQDGLVSALGWVAEETALPWMDFWLPLTNFPRLQQIALRAFSIRRLKPSANLSGFFAATDAGTREVVCILAGRLRLAEYLVQLQAARKDAEPAVREAAAVALLLLGQGAAVLADLWQASLHWNQIAQDGKGWIRSMATRRAQAVARYIGHALPLAHPGLRDLMERIPARQGLIVLAHHGDPATLPWALAAMARKDLARLAAWSVTMVTGVDLDRRRLTTAAPPADEDEDERQTPLQDPDVGLPWPHAEAVVAWWRKEGMQFPGGTRLLFGSAASDRAHCLSLLSNGVQAARWAAALNLAQSDMNIPYLATNAPALAQQRAMHLLPKEA